MTANGGSLCATSLDVPHTILPLSLPCCCRSILTPHLHLHLITVVLVVPPTFVPLYLFQLHQQPHNRSMPSSTFNGKIVSSSPGGGARPNSKVTVHLLDVTLQERGSMSIGGQVIQIGPRGRPFPIAFKVPYDERAGSPTHRYSVSVRVEDTGGDERLRWISTTHIPVLTHGHPVDNITVVVHAVPE